MTRALVLVLVAAAGCTEPPPDAPGGCQVELSGNFRESIASTTNCPTIVAGVGATQGDTILRFGVTSAELGGDLAIDLDLDQTPTPGLYTSATTALWNATGIKSVLTDGACLFLAGNNSTPSGNFELELRAIEQDTAHGELVLTMFVLPRAQDDGTQSDCGPGTTEDIQIEF